MPLKDPEALRNYQNAYYRMRWATDPTYRAKQGAKQIKRRSGMNNEQKQAERDARRPYSRTYQRTRYWEDDAYREYHATRSRLRLKMRKQFLQSIVDEMKHGGCIYCKETTRECLDMHHIDLKEKRGSIAHYVSSFCSEITLREELAKVVCVCANCHRKLHAGLLDAEVAKRALQDWSMSQDPERGK